MKHEACNMKHKANECMIKVFIENEAGSDKNLPFGQNLSAHSVRSKKNIFDEKTLEYKKTVTISRVYPFPYGFIPETKSGDDDCLDCFVITKQKLNSRQVVECEPIGLVEQFEDGQEDHKILAILKGEDYILTNEAKELIKEFIEHVFDHLPKKTKMVKVGKFLDKKAAEELIQKSFL